MSRLIAAILSAAFLTLSPVALKAADTVRHAPPEPALTVAISAASAQTAITFQPTGIVSLQSDLGPESYNSLETFFWKPAGATASAKVPAVIVAHGHGGVFYCSTSNDARTIRTWSPSCYLKLQTQFVTLAKELTDRGVAMLLVNSFTEDRSSEIVDNRHGGDSSWAIYPLGLGDNRDDLASDHLSRPYDLTGAARNVTTALPWIDGTKLVALGYSHGGTAALAMDLSNHPVNLDEPQGGAHLFSRVFTAYPGCGMGSTTKRYAGSGAVVPLVLGTASADQVITPSTMPGDVASGDCRARYDAARTAHFSNPSLFKFDWWQYTGAGHGWESTATTANNAARVHFRKLVADYAAGLK